MGAEQSCERDNWTVVQGIGVGAFGSVMAVTRAKDEGKAQIGGLMEEKAGSYAELKKRGTTMCAMKCISKRGVIDSDAVKGTLAEMQLMAEILPSPFILRLHSAFQDPACLYLVTDLCAGGTVSQLIKARGQLTDASAKFLFVQLVLGVAHLHSQGIVHMDIKPANCLLTNSGQLKLADFNGSHRWPHAMSKFDSKKCDLFGTSGFLAPEVLADEPGFTACAPDWWSSGCTLFAMLKGRDASPWLSEKNYGKRQKWRSWEDELRAICAQKTPLLSGLTADATSMLEGLLQLDYKTRLGCRERGAREVKDHAYIKDTNWQRVENRTGEHAKPPFEVSDAAFAQVNQEKTRDKWLSETLQATLMGEEVSDKEQLLFKDWHVALDQHGRPRFKNLRELQQMKTAQEVRAWINRAGDTKVWALISDIKTLSSMAEVGRKELEVAKDMIEMLQMQNTHLKGMIRDAMSNETEADKKAANKRPKVRKNRADPGAQVLVNSRSSPAGVDKKDEKR